eukprot:CAMPEP_0113723616 /NCGR_PEP_ID=MMETSP0038_2-20120614/38540_1 /TAXON_ID=2898 /ORGANISM="Cryptomonas paramecium" /LENGTH=55 /DNA_ID=CAMNT_0000653261 /DNA_START=47 /DNA_END=211 /DNA_ORIENTATION=- /assembly_acc=CAM_ASM_000170
MGDGVEAAADALEGTGVVEPDDATEAEEGSEHRQRVQSRGRASSSGLGGGGGGAA